MDPNSPTFQKWLRTSLNDEFGTVMDKWLEKEHDGFKISQQIVESKKMKKFMQTTKENFIEQTIGKQESIPETTRPRTSVTLVANDLFEDDDWSLEKENGQDVEKMIQDIGSDKTDHVRLAGFEILFKLDVSNLTDHPSWELFLAKLRDAVCDGSQPVFEASLQMHTKLLGFPYLLHDKSTQVFVNLITAYESLTQVKKFNESTPTSISGVNFKMMMHEKLCRIMFLLIRYQEEILKSYRHSNRNMEDILEHFFTFLSSSVSVTQTKTLNALNILAIFQPQGEWSKKWNHGLLTRRVFCNNLSRVPSLINYIIANISKYLEHPPVTIPVSIADDINETYISGDSVDSLTYLHNLNFIAQLYGSSSGRGLLFELLTDDCFCTSELLLNMLNCLNVSVVSSVSNDIYDAMHKSLIYVINQPIVYCDAKLFSLALKPLMYESNNYVWPHIMDVLLYMLRTSDGCAFLVAEYHRSANAHKQNVKYPAEIILLYASGLLKQPLSVMNIEHLKCLFKVVEQLFCINAVYDIVGDVLRHQFFPALTYFYANVDKYFVENENKTQKFNNAARDMLLKSSLNPMVLRNIIDEPTILRELIQDSIAPLRSYWNINKVVAFISNAAFFSLGVELIRRSATYILSTFIIELCKSAEQVSTFHDPWTDQNTVIFQHILSLFSLNTRCFMALVETGKDEEKRDHPGCLDDLYQHCLQPDSPFHHISLISLKSSIWNMDVLIYLWNLLNFQEELLKMQENCIIELEEEGELKEKYIVDECSLLRHMILTNCHRLEHKIWNYDYHPEECRLFSKLPPFVDPNESENNKHSKTESKSNAKTEFDELLEDDSPGFRDSSWVSETRRAFRNSETVIMTVSVYNLLIQMQEAIPTVDWLELFTWDNETANKDDYWSPEEMVGFDVAINYARANGIALIQDEPQHLLKSFIEQTYNYIKFDKNKQFSSFDWFLSTVFIFCKGDVTKCKTFVTHFMKFPSAMFIWPTLCEIVDESNNEEATTNLLFAQLLETIVSNEFSSSCNALKHNCGCSWWMICNRLISQCFWGILPWTEILNYFIICIIYPPDYVLYYCASLLNHCQYNLRQDVSNGKLWPQHLNLHDYKCHTQIGFMDQLGKRYRGKILPQMVQQKLKIPEEES